MRSTGGLFSQIPGQALGAVPAPINLRAQGASPWVDATLDIPSFGVGVGGTTRQWCKGTLAQAPQLGHPWTVYGWGISAACGYLANAASANAFKWPVITGGITLDSAFLAQNNSDSQELPPPNNTFVYGAGAYSSPPQTIVDSEEVYDGDFPYYLSQTVIQNISFSTTLPQPVTLDDTTQLFAFLEMGQGFLCGQTCFVANASFFITYDLTENAP